MANLADGPERDKYLEALAEWSCTGGIRWTERAGDLLRDNFGISQKDVGRLMMEHAQAGGKIDQVVERRWNWEAHHKFHYDMCLEICGKRVYIETRLIEDSRLEDPYIQVVQIKESSS